MDQNSRRPNATRLNALRALSEPLSGVDQPLLTSRNFLNKIEERYRIGMWFWDYKTKTFDWDAGMRLMNGLDLDGPMPSGEDMRKIFASDDRWMMNSVIKYGLPISAWVNVIRYNNQEERFHFCYVDIVNDEDGSPSLAVGFVQDITLYKRLEEKVLALTLGRQAEVASLGILSWIANISGDIVFEAGLSRHVGAPPELLAGDALLLHFHPDDRLAVARWRTRVTGGESEPTRMPVRLRDQNGRYVHYSAAASVIVMPRNAKRLESWTLAPLTSIEGKAQHTELRPELLKASRAILNWTHQDLASASGVSVPTIARYESGATLRPTTASRLIEALARKGVVIDVKRDGALSLTLHPSNLPSSSATLPSPD